MMNFDFSYNVWQLNVVRKVNVHPLIPSFLVPVLIVLQIAVVGL
jgi:hypothetical protein